MNSESTARPRLVREEVITPIRAQFHRPTRGELEGSWRYIEYDEKRDRLEMRGKFTSEDLRRLAAWLDDPSHPVVSEDYPVIKVKLSPP